MLINPFKFCDIVFEYIYLSLNCQTIFKYGGIMTVFSNSNLMKNIIQIERLILEVKKAKPNLNDDEALLFVLKILNFNEFKNSDTGIK